MNASSVQVTQRSIFSNFLLVNTMLRLHICHIRVRYISEVDRIKWHLSIVKSHGQTTPRDLLSSSCCDTNCCLL